MCAYTWTHEASFASAARRAITSTVLVLPLAVFATATTADNIHQCANADNTAHPIPDANALIYIEAETLHMYYSYSTSY
jgi:hypothetical protein